MTVEEFKSSFRGKEPPVCLSIEMKALWYAAKDDWNKAHMLIQNEEDKKCALVHAWLHRVEGDNFNADYWYSKAGFERPKFSAEEEFYNIVEKLI